jgi:hypothetical protein
MMAASEGRAISPIKSEMTLPEVLLADRFLPSKRWFAVRIWCANESGVARSEVEG